MSDDLTTSGRSFLENFPELTSSAQEFHASLQVPQVSERVRMIRVSSGQKCFAMWQHISQSGLWQKTLLESFLLSSEGLSTRFTHRWSVKVIAPYQFLFQLRRLERGTSDNGYSLLPTLTVRDVSGHAYTLDHGDKRKRRLSLVGRVRLMPTLQARDHFPPHKPEYIAAKKALGHGMRNLNDEIGGPLNPTWCEWYMGFPLGWTELQPSATPLSRKSRSGLAGESSKRKRKG